MGHHLELHSTHAVVEVPAKDAHIRGIGTDHLAHFEGICVRQPVQHGAGNQARGCILLPPAFSICPLTRGSLGIARLYLRTMARSGFSTFNTVRVASKHAPLRRTHSHESDGPGY